MKRARPTEGELREARAYGQGTNVPGFLRLLLVLAAIGLVLAAVSPVIAETHH
jgi:hypothetical protein